MTTVKHEIVTRTDGRREHRIATRGRWSFEWFTATLLACNCDKILCKNDHVRWNAAAREWKVSEYDKDRCAAGYRSRGQRCHAWHDSDVEALIARVLRTYDRGRRAYTPSLPTRSNYRPTGKPEAIAVRPEDLRHEGEMLIEDVREQLALAWSDVQKHTTEGVS